MRCVPPEGLLRITITWSRFAKSVNPPASAIASSTLTRFTILYWSGLRTWPTTENFGNRTSLRMTFTLGFETNWPRRAVISFCSSTTVLSHDCSGAEIAFLPDEDLHHVVGTQTVLRRRLRRDVAGVLQPIGLRG